MFFVKSKSPRLGLRASLTLWTTLMLAASLAAGFAWVHYALLRVLEFRNDSSIERKSREMADLVGDTRLGGQSALEAEISREVTAYKDEGLVVVIRRPSAVLAAPPSETSRRLADQMTSVGVGLGPQTVTLPGTGERYRVVRTNMAPSWEPGCSLDLALSLAETETTLAQFDRRVAAGALAFLGLAAFGGLLLSRQALRPVAQSIRTAKGLNPQNLSARLPRSGADDELDQLAGTINDLLDRLAAYHAQVIRFTADASHELRSPLGAMRAAVEVSLQQPRSMDEYRETLASLGEQCDRLTTLVNGLLLLARADVGELVLKREPVDLASLTNEVGEMFEPLAEERGVLLHRDCPPLPSIRGDASRLRQLVTNLVDNAIKFTPEGGSVSLQVENAGDRAKLTVSDTGSGIPEEHLPHIFDRFYQADPARASEGYGLGLSICKWIVDAHGGLIRVESPQGKGTRFTVIFETC
jgi:heavy metal sensor kinase